MATVHVDLDTVKVLDGQGIGEGNFELNIKAQEGGNVVHWPDPYPASNKVDQGGGVKSIGKRVAAYDIDNGTLSKKFTITVREIDKGTLGQDDEGVGWVTFDLTGTMAPDTRSVTIPLKRPNMKSELGKVKVTLTAQRV
jgi:hypothetical protein